MAEIGLLRGLAQDLGYNQRVNDLHYNEQADLRAQQLASARAALMANDLDYNAALNSHDNPIIKDFAQQQIKKIGSYYRDNPDALYNPMKLAELNRMKRELKDNPDLNRGLASDMAYREYLKDLQETAKNPNQRDEEAYRSYQDQWGNYLKFGNQDGEQAALTEGKKPFLYVKPRDFVNLDEVGISTGNKLKDFNIVKGKNIGEYWTEPKPEQANALAHSFYMENRRQLDIEAPKRGLRSGEELAKQIVSSGFNKHYSIGDANALWERGMREKELRAKTQKPEASNYTPFDNFTDPRIPAGQNTPEIFRKVYGDKPNITVLGNTGLKADLTGLDFNYDGRWVKRNGVPMLLGYVKVPLELAYQKGIIAGDKKDVEAGNFGDNGVRISSDFLGKAAFEKTPDLDGKGKPYVKVSWQMPVNPNDQTARQMYNVYADVDKLVPASQDPYSQPQKKVAPPGAQVDQAGNVFDASGNFIGKRDEF